jgi:hypothetical protein
MTVSKPSSLQHLRVLIWPASCSAGARVKLGLGSRGGGVYDQESVETHAWALGVLFPFSVDGPPMLASAHVSRPPKKLSKMGFDEVSFQPTELEWGG